MTQTNLEFLLENAHKEVALVESHLEVCLCDKDYLGAARMQESLSFLRAKLEKLKRINNDQNDQKDILRMEIILLESRLKRIAGPEQAWIAYPPESNPDEAVAELKAKLAAKKKQQQSLINPAPTIDSDHLLELLEDLEAQKISKAELILGEIFPRIDLVIFDDKLRISLATESSSDHETLDELTLKKLKKLGFSPQHCNIDLPIKGGKNKQDILQTLAALLIDVLKVDMNDTIKVVIKSFPF